MESHLHLRELTSELKRERRLVEELRDALARQRAGVANDDRAAVAASVGEVGRIVSTLEQARRRRATMVGVITGDEGFPLARLEECLASPLPEGFRRARTDLREGRPGGGRGCRHQPRGAAPCGRGGGGVAQEPLRPRHRRATLRSLSLAAR